MLTSDGNSLALRNCNMLNDLNDIIVIVVITIIIIVIILLSLSFCNFMCRHAPYFCQGKSDRAEASQQFEELVHSAVRRSRASSIHCGTQCGTYSAWNQPDISYPLHPSRSSPLWGQASLQVCKSNTPVCTYVMKYILTIKYFMCIYIICYVLWWVNNKTYSFCFYAL